MTAEDGRGAPDVPADPRFDSAQSRFLRLTSGYMGLFAQISDQTPTRPTPERTPTRGPARRTDVPSAMAPARPVATLRSWARRRWFAFHKRRACSRHHVERSNRACRAAGRSG
jgi:hypothetical protein